MTNSKTGKRIALLAGCVVVVVVGVAVWVCREDIRFVWLFESIGENDQGYPEYRHRQTGIVFVSLPGGTFNMGSPEDERERHENEGPVHEVTLSPFMIAKYEVSQAEWEKVMGDNPSKFKGDKLPVEQVYWEDCQQFCEKTSLKLPTEAQWEYACRAGKNGPFAGTGILGEVGWYNTNSGEEIHPVGQKAPNDFGLYDMHGNVSEWCQDVFDPKFYSKPESARTDPLCTSGSKRVLRGGCYYYLARLCRSAYRGWFHPSYRDYSVGFRPSASFRE